MTLRSTERLSITEQSTCFACGPNHPHGLRLQFTQETDGSQVACCLALPEWEGFTGMIHGGILATLADEAMSKAVVAQGWEALTGELTVRYHHRVTPGDALVIRGWIISQRGRLIRAKAIVTTENDIRCLSAQSLFVIVPVAPTA